MNSEMVQNLIKLYKLTPFINTSRKNSLIQCLRYKSDKVQLVFENVTNPLNAVINLYKYI